MLEFSSAQLLHIGGTSGLRDRQWATLEIRLTDTETDHTMSVEIKLLVPRRPDATLRELEEAARTSAVATLEAARNLLSQSSLAELRETEQAREDAEAAERKRSFDLSFGEG